MNRGSIWWVELEGDAGFRPVVIVSRDDRPRREKVTIAEITRTIRSIPSEVPLGTSDGMDSECVINTDNLATIPVGCFRQRITELSPDLLFSLGSALRFSLDLDW